MAETAAEAIHQRGRQIFYGDHLHVHWRRPVMELIPFSSSGAGAALTAFGLALIANDGFLGLLAFVLTAVTAGLVAYYLL